MIIDTLNKVMPVLNSMVPLLSIFFVLLSIISALEEKRKYDKLYEKDVDSNKKGTLIDNLLNFKLLRKFHSSLELRLKELGKEDSMNYFFSGTLIFIIIATVFMIAMKQYFIAIFIPIILLKFFSYLLKLIARDSVEEIEKVLPMAIDNVIRVNSKYSDLRTVLYEASITTPQPVASIFSDMARKMMTSPQDEVLMNFAESYDSVWIYSFCLILVSYLEDSNQEDTLKNLKNLRDMLERENFLMSKKITENRYGVVVNYTIAFLGFFAFVVNLIFNPYAKTFFFATIPGLVAFFLGMGCLLFTVVVNIKLLHNNK